MINLLSIESLTALGTLVFLEIILGIDNVIFISIVANKLPIHTRKKAWRFGLVLALAIRIAMLFTISWIMNFSEPLIAFSDFQFSIREIILMGGGLFLVYKSTTEISQGIAKINNGQKKEERPETVLSVVLQIVFIDFVFSFDSILTAVGLSNTIYIMVTAVLISMAIMMFFLGAIGEFIKRNPTIEILALAFLILIGFILVLESFHYNIPKGYIYFAVAFSFTIELLNIRKRKMKQFENQKTQSVQIDNHSEILKPS
jgi:predicted tellurium resistance membrane protein TerC